MHELGYCEGVVNTADAHTVGVRAPACPRCGNVSVEVSGGDELVLEWIEYLGSRDVDPGPERAGR